MGSRVSCSRNHWFDLPEGGEIHLITYPLHCPVCGVVVADSPGALRDLLHPDGLPGTDPEIDLPPEQAPERVSQVSQGPPFPARYEVIQALGKGGLGSVFVATDKALGRRVALKMHAPLSADNPRQRDRLRHRARAAAGLSHPHFVRVIDYGEQDGWFWEAQELMGGGDLTQLLQRDGPLSARRAAELLTPVAHAVQYLHEHGYVHRNLKPRKVLLTADGTPKLADLDLAKRLDGEPGDEEPEGTIVGTPPYMAPEQAQGDSRKIGPATDVYGLGAILYETLTGRPPTEGRGVMDILRRVVTAEPVPPRRLRPDLPAELEGICLRCLDKDPDQRYPSASSLAGELEYFLADRPLVGSAGAPPGAAESGMFEPAPRSAADDTGTFGPAPYRPPTPPRRGARPRLWDRFRNWARGWLGAARDQVDATVFAPPTVRPRQEFLVQVFAHLPTQGEDARRLALEFDPEAERRGVTSLELEVSRGERLAFHLTLPGLLIDPPQASLVWQGRPASVQFRVSVPREHVPGGVVGTVTVSLQSVPVGHVKFKLVVAEATSRVSPAEPVATGESARLYRQAFISYASADRKEVLKRVQMLARLRIRFFQDLLDLDPGVRWQKELYRNIDQSDLFLLFWSTRARESKWVLEEVRYAINRKGDNDLAPPEILPIVIEGPPPPEPPEELAHLHFNDYLLYLMQSPRP